MSFDSIIARLETSIDATDRVKAAAELGEVGTPEVAPILLKAVWEDSQSGVRQAAITSYVEVLGEDAYPELEKVITSHFDAYVRLNAISMLSKLPKDMSLQLLQKGLDSDDDKVRTLSIRELYLIGAKELAPRFVELLRTESYHLAKRNLIEALAIWKVNEAKDIIKQVISQDSDPEIQGIGVFGLAALGEPGAKEKLENMDIDPFIRIKFDNEWFRGKEGLLSLLKRIND
ncbi:MAG: HEAT repeat domain-containing protein [Methanobacteriota archaeon]|nr:MAG: HEAT repeat domain-containing protein [Euryarchaeota archaeon]